MALLSHFPAHGNIPLVLLGSAPRRLRFHMVKAAGIALLIDAVLTPFVPSAPSSANVTTLPI